MAALGSMGTSPFESLVVVNISQPPTCLPLGCYHFLAESKLRICLHAGSLGLVGKWPELEQNRLLPTDLGRKNVSHSVYPLAGKKA